MKTMFTYYLLALTLALSFTLTSCGKSEDEKPNEGDTIPLERTTWVYTNPDGITMQLKFITKSDCILSTGIKGFNLVLDYKYETKYPNIYLYAVNNETIGQKPTDIKGYIKDNTMYLTKIFNNESLGEFEKQ